MATNRDDGLIPISEAAHYFGKSIEWIRFHEMSGNFRDKSGSKIEPIRYLTETGKLGARAYSLDMIEEMAESLYRLYKISKYKKENVVDVVKALRVVQKW